MDDNKKQLLEIIEKLSNNQILFVLTLLKEILGLD